MKPIAITASAIRSCVVHAGLWARRVGDFLRIERKQDWIGDLSKERDRECGDEMLVIVPAADARSYWSPGSAPTQKFASPFADLDFRNVAN